MEIFEKAKELANLIGVSDELMELRSAEENLLGDPEAMEVLNAFNEVRREYVQVASETNDEKIIGEYKHKLLEKNNALFANATTKSYLDAKNKVDNIFKGVSNILQRVINGLEEEDGGCGSGCSSCGGGCC